MLSSMAAMTSDSSQAGTMIAIGCSARARSCSEVSGLYFRFTVGSRHVSRVQNHASMNRSSIDEIRISTATSSAARSSQIWYSAIR